MDSKKRRRLEAAGWRVGTVQEFLRLSDAEAELVEMHLRLTDEIKRRIEKAKISQARLAEELGTSAPRLSNMLAGKQVSTDALVRALIVLGASVKEVGKVVGGEKPKSKSRRRAA
jgi:predicted XRE-type DNA-binding protein